MFLHEPRRDNESKYCILWCHRNAPNLQINWSHRITNKTLEAFIILASSGSLRIQILRPKKKKRVELRHFNSSALEIIKRACSIKDKRNFFHYPCDTPPSSSSLFLLSPSLFLPPSPPTHTQEGIHEQGPWEDTAILWTQDPDQRNIWNIDTYHGNWWK